MSDWRTKHDQDLSALDVAAMRTEIGRLEMAVDDLYANVALAELRQLGAATLATAQAVHERLWHEERPR